MTKKEYYDTFSNAELNQHIDDYHLLLEILNDDFLLAAKALKYFTNIESNNYYIMQILEFRRYWILLKEIETILDLPMHEIQAFTTQKIKTKKDTKPTVKRHIKISTATITRISNYKLGSISRLQIRQSRALTIVRGILFPRVQSKVKTVSDLIYCYGCIEATPRAVMRSSNTNTNGDKRMRENRTYVHWRTKKYLERITA